MGEITWFPLIIPRSKNENVGKMKEMRKTRWDFPGGPMVRNLPAKAGDTGSTTSLGRFMYHGATKPVRPNYWAHVLQPVKPMSPRTRALQQEKSTQWAGAHEPQLQNGPHLPQLEKARVQPRRPARPKIKKTKNDLLTLGDSAWR